MLLLWILRDIVSMTSVGRSRIQSDLLIVRVMGHVASAFCLSLAVAELHEPPDVITILVVATESAGRCPGACLRTYMVSRPIRIEDRWGDDHVTFLDWCNDVHYLLSYTRSERYRARVIGGGIAHRKRWLGAGLQRIVGRSKVVPCAQYRCR